ncbi:hypothetical protein BSFA1_00210 [Burkholderia sp. SFA1]|nr:hypothetical protein BSFA1_00210 [Burkholderia sp. SFA1]
MTLELRTPDDLALLSETVTIECKLAQGQNGQGELPKDFWPTYSAMANTHGGVVLLGVREKNGIFSLAGIPDADKVRRDLFSTLNNSSKVSVNLLTDDNVVSHVIEGQTILVVHIPQATRHQRPVYLNNQPMGNTWKRLNEGDTRCDDETVRRMMVEQVEDDRDQRILVGYGLEDIDPESLRIYRQMLRDKYPEHPFLDVENLEFLRQIGAWRRDRQTDVAGLTVAGLLMFGHWASIQEGMPHYFVDYQERPEAQTERRWVDRLVPDGSWSGNVFEFYRRVYRKLVSDLKVPFELKGGQRQEDTQVHVALREALVNTLVHADYTGRVSVLVVKRPDMFGFRNPGCLRLPLAQVVQGGESDCRNRLMHQMFLMIGLGERAGSGIPKIFSGWRSQHWRQPLLHEKDEPEQTLLELRMLDLLPEPVIKELHDRFGESFDALDGTDRLILATARIEGVVNHTRLAEISGDVHPRDLSARLARLERQGTLQSSGQSRGKVYFLPGARPVSPDDVFFESPGSSHSATSSSHNGASSPHSADSSTHNAASSAHSDQHATQVASRNLASDRDVDGCLLSPLLDAPVIDSLETLSPILLAELEQRAGAPRERNRVEVQVMEAAILAVCTGRYVRLEVLAKLVKRNPNGLRDRYLDSLVRTQRIWRAFPGTPNHEMQAYRTNDENGEHV